MNFNTISRKNVLLPVLAMLLFAKPLCTIAQPTNEEFHFQMEFEQTAQVIVMITGDYLGAGFIFGHDKDRLLIATAGHVVQRGNQQAGNIGIRFRNIRDTLKATVLKQVNQGDMDLAVLSVENLSKHGVNPCAFPVGVLRMSKPLERGDGVFPVGNPEGNAWVLPMQADKISNIRQKQIEFQSTFIKSGHSGGGLLDENANLVGLLTADASPYGRAIPIDAVLQQIKQWGFEVLLQRKRFREERYDPPLHKAAEKGDLGEISKLLQQCNNPNEIDYHYRTPLHYAANAATVSMLVKAGASTNVFDFNGCSPLYLAVGAGSADKVKELVKAGARIDSTTADFLLPLHRAADTAINPDIAKFLIQSGADVNVEDDDRVTPLFLAAMFKNIKVARMLVDARASIDHVDNNGSTPLHVAINRHDINMIRLLVGSGANLNPRNSTTPLHIAAFNTQAPEIISFLIKSGANVNAKDETGNTPLHYAVGQRGEPNEITECLSILLKAGADPNIKNDEGLTVLALAKNVHGSSDESNAMMTAISQLLNKFGGK